MAKDGLLGSSGFKPFRVNIKSSSQNYRGKPEVHRAYANGMGQLYDILGQNLLGLKFGEADATFYNHSPTYMYPFSRKRENLVKPFQDHLWFFADQIGYRVRGHNNDSGYHYLAKENTFTQSGSQILVYKGQDLRSTLAWHRGANKQYGLLSELQFSGRGWTATQRRQFYAAYLANVALLATEFGLTKGSDTNEYSDFGEMVWQGIDFVNNNPSPGTLQTPVAFMLDYDNGWRPWHHSKTFRIWNVMRYNLGDYQTYAHFAEAYPNYDNGDVDKYETNNRRAQRYAMADTPYGDSFDILLNDARQDVLNKYAVVVASGDFNTHLESTREKIESFVQQGGQFIVTGENAKKLWPDMNIGQTVTTVPKRARIVWANNPRKRVVESYEFELLSIGSIPAGASVKGTYQGTPVVIEYPMGAGTITISLSRYGTRKNENTVKWSPGFSNSNTEFMNPLSRVKHPLVGHYREMLIEKFKASRLFDVGGQLGVQYMVCKTENPNEYTIGVFNDTKTSKYFKITSHIGTILSEQELTLTDLFLKTRSDFYPQNVSPGLSDATHIEAGDVRLFRVLVDENGVNTKNKISPENQPVGKLLALDTPANLRYKISTWPSFFYHFNGFKLTGTALRNYSKAKLIEDAVWLNYNNMQLVVDARDLSNEDDLLDVLDKMKVLTHSSHVLVNGFYPNLMTEIVNTSIALSIGSSSDINLIDHNAAPNASASVNVLDLDYEKWDDIYHDVKKAFYSSTNIGLRGQVFVVPNPSVQSVSNFKRNRLLAFRKVDDVKEAIEDTPGFFSHFGGLMVEAEYLRQSDDKKCLEEKQYLDTTNLRMIVDLSPQMDHYSTISMYSQTGSVYQRGLIYITDVFDKMQMMGLDLAVINVCAEDNNKQYWIDGLEEMCQLAAARGITLCARNRGSWNTAKGWISDLSGTVSNLKIAATTAIKNTAARSAFSDQSITGVILLANSDGNHVNRVPFPISASGFSTIYSNYAISTSLPIVLEAEYLDQSELDADIAQLFW
ncbi:hypothetical protein [Poriferisphaera sp. WC338]|uniref:hypothetical protein n=1 Tax=Poriferisphaera sp. WC338 TaxID=3425129 RepID=UPI003D816D61